MNPEDRENQKPIKALRTYQGDVEEVLSKTKSSTATIMLAEEKRREERPELAPRRREVSGERNRLYLVLGSFLLFLAISIVGGVYYIRLNEKVVVKPKEKALIAFTKEVKIQTNNTSNENLSKKIETEVERFNQEINSVLNINLTDDGGETISAEESVKKISKNIPAELSRSFDGKYMIGVYSFDTNTPFIILKTSDYENSYSGMLKWERDIPRDLAGIFKIPKEIINNKVAFIDEAYKNKDFRVLVDSSGKSVLLYSFIDKNTLFITTNENVFSALFGKYIINQEYR